MEQYSYDGLGRRVKKTITHMAGLNGTEWYYYDGHRQIEMRNGSGQVMRQYVWGTQYVDP